MTAPDFRPFERKFKGSRHLGRATFLHCEEGEEWNEGSESENDDDDGESYSVPDSPVSNKRKRGPGSSKAIYIDQVMERARQ